MKAILNSTGLLYVYMGITGLTAGIAYGWGDYWILPFCALAVYLIEGTLKRRRG